MNPLLFGIGIALVSYCVYTLIQMWSARQWSRAKFPLHRDYEPTITLLKPVRGVDAEEYENFASFCQQDYPQDRYQILFGALNKDDPALEIARCLQNDFPQIDIGIVAEAGTLEGLNRKVCNLVQMLPFAKHEILIICDSDMRVTPDYLRRVVAPLREGYAAVTCPYRGHLPQSPASVFEALGIGADFIPSVLTSRFLEGVAFGFGSTIALPRQHLETLGGLASLKDHLADDFQIGYRIAQAGHRVALADYVVLDVLGSEPFRTMWDRRLRWARTLRACRPLGYAGSLVTHGTAIATLFLLCSGFSPLGLAVWIGTVAFRIITALCVSLFWTHDPNVVRYAPLLPLSDLLSFTLFCMSFMGSTLVWRGEQFRVRRDGLLIPYSRNKPNV
jgi:ceramide glucosyltransferase